MRPRLVRTSSGPVEVAEAGDGPPLLSVHGSFGGWDAGIGMAALFALNGFRVIAPSRPGFLGTPLDTGRTYEEQADALAALLNALGVDETAAVGFSGGGPPLFLLAARFPSLVRCLIGVSTVSGPFPPRTPRQRLLWTVAGHRVLLETVVRAFRFLAVRRPRVALQRGMAEETDLPRAALDALTRRIEADPVRRAFASRVYGGTMLSRAGERFPGQRNDDALLLGLRGLPLTGVRCPALLVGGARDPLRGHTETAARRIRGAESRWTDDGHRGLWLGDGYREDQAFVLGWLREHAHASPGSSPAGARRGPERSRG